MNDLSSVQWNDEEGLQIFLMENALQHQLFRSTLGTKGFPTPSFNLFDLQIENIDDWMLPHQNEHEAYAEILGLDNPINLLDMNWNDETQFYDWMADHYYIHTAIAASLGLSNA